jgi:O-acetyl-ADP-ribose deacetylase (regulator of RNase III)
VFGYAPALAAPLAVTTVRAWLDNHAGPGMRVVFNVFLDSDKELYERILFEQH